jgi:DNA polymerase (family 10)
MPIQNSEIAERIDRLADLLAIRGENPFRVRAYRNAAFEIRTFPRRLSAMVEAGEDLTEIHGVGATIARAIEELVRSGHLTALERIERREGHELADLLRIPGLGPKRVRLLHEALGVRSREDLERAARSGRIAELPGLGAKTEESILRALARGTPEDARTPWAEAEPAADALCAYLEGLSGVEKVIVAGSYRRGCETVGDLDVVVTARDGAAAIGRFTDYEDVERVISRGSTRATVLLRSGLQVDVRVVPAVSYGAALVYLTGSKAHSVRLRARAVKRHLKLNEYGLYRGAKRIAGSSEASIYKALGLAVVPPELREDRGEIEAAESGALPQLVKCSDLRGDLHVHTNASDGHASLAAMAAAARERGYAYLAVADHTQALRIAHGLDPKRLRRQLRAIEKLNEGFSGFQIVKAAEVEILADGTLDLPDSVLAELDIVIGAVHSHFDLPAQRQTDRILRAMDQPRFQLLAHPTGRLLQDRNPYPLEVERLIQGAAARGVWLEINSQPRRLDLSDTYARMAAEHGALLAISSDAHDVYQLANVRHGITQARRGWLTKTDIVNTRTLAGLRRAMRH